MNQRSPINPINKIPKHIDCVNLSLTDKEIESIYTDTLSKERIELRTRASISGFRTLVEEKMHHKDSLHITLWGVWEEIESGFYAIKSSLDNVFLDSELSLPFISDQTTYEQVFDQYLHNTGDGGVNIADSILCRNSHYRAALNLFKQITGTESETKKAKHIRIPFSQSGCFPANPLLLKGAGTEFKALLDLYADRVDRNLAFGLCPFQYNPNKIQSSHYKIANANHILAKFRNDLRSNLKSGDSWVTLSTEDIFGRGVRDQNKNYGRMLHEGKIHNSVQRFFIDLRTLSLLSVAKRYNSAPETERLWLHWSALCLFSGIPLNPIRAFDCNDNEMPRSISPHRGEHASTEDVCPIYNIIAAMWSLGAAEEFQIQLNLDHPVTEKRGAYITFQLAPEKQVNYSIEDDINGLIPKEQKDLFSGSAKLEHLFHILELHSLDERYTNVKIDNVFDHITLRNPLREAEKNKPKTALELFEESMKEVNP